MMLSELFIKVVYALQYIPESLAVAVSGLFLMFVLN